MSVWRDLLRIVTFPVTFPVTLLAVGAVWALNAAVGGLNRVVRPRERRVLTQLDRIEAEMRRIGFWKDDPPDLLADYADGTRRSFLDAPTFELWLQVVFLHNARAAARAGTMPASSQVGLMAMRQYDYMEHVPHAQTLLWLLGEFDAIVEGRAREDGPEPGRV